jgi:plastocyanin
MPSVLVPRIPTHRVDGHRLISRLSDAEPIDGSGACLLAFLLLGLLLFDVPGQGAEISGNIHITRRLTKRRMTPVAGAYRRGVRVEPAGNARGLAEVELERVAIYLEGAPREAPGVVAAVLKQKDRRFMEETVVVPAGSTVSFPNLDPIFHNVFSLSSAKSFDLGNYSQNQTRVVKFPKPGIVRVYCHLHPNMSATVVVTPNRWAGRPNAAGRYTLSDVPAGDYTVVAWHKSAGTFRENVHVIEGGNVDLDFTIPIGVDSKTRGER